MTTHNHPKSPKGFDNGTIVQAIRRRQQHQNKGLPVKKKSTEEDPALIRYWHSLTPNQQYAFFIAAGVVGMTSLALLIHLAPHLLQTTSTSTATSSTELYNPPAAVPVPVASTSSLLQTTGTFPTPKLPKLEITPTKHLSLSVSRDQKGNVNQEARTQYKKLTNALQNAWHNILTRSYPTKFWVDILSQVSAVQIVSSGERDIACAHAGGNRGCDLNGYFFDGTIYISSIDNSAMAITHKNYPAVLERQLQETLLQEMWHKLVHMINAIPGNPTLGDYPFRDESEFMQVKELIDKLDELFVSGFTNKRAESQGVSIPELRKAITTHYQPMVYKQFITQEEYIQYQIEQLITDDAQRSTIAPGLITQVGTLPTYIYASAPRIYGTQVVKSITYSYGRPDDPNEVFFAFLNDYRIARLQVEKAELYKKSDFDYYNERVNRFFSMANHEIWSTIPAAAKLLKYLERFFAPLLVDHSKIPETTPT